MQPQGQGCRQLVQGEGDGASSQGERGTHAPQIYLWGWGRLPAVGLGFSCAALQGGICSPAGVTWRSRAESGRAEKLLTIVSSMMLCQGDPMCKAPCHHLCYCQTCRGGIARAVWSSQRQAVFLHGPALSCSTRLYPQGCGGPGGGQRGGSLSLQWGVCTHPHTTHRSWGNSSPLPPGSVCSCGELSTPTQPQQTVELWELDSTPLQYLPPPAMARGLQTRVPGPIALEAVLGEQELWVGSEGYQLGCGWRARGPRRAGVGGCGGRVRGTSRTRRGCAGEQGAPTGQRGCAGLSF